MPLKFGFVIPGGRAKTVVNFAREAERAGWEGVFYYDSIWIEELPEVHSAWAILEQSPSTLPKFASALF